MLETKLKLGLNDQGRLLTDQEFAEASYEEPYQYERVGGRLVVMSPNDLVHTQIVSAILERLYLYKSVHPGAIVLIAPEGWMRTADHTDRIGDVAVYLEEISTDHIYDAVPGLVFEVVNKGSEERDYVLKRNEYFNLGVEEYMIVDPFRQIVTVLIHREGGYLERELKAGDAYLSNLLPGFELVLSDLPW